MMLSIIAITKKNTVLNPVEGITGLINAHSFSRETDFFL